MKLRNLIVIIAVLLAITSLMLSVSSILYAGEFSDKETETENNGYTVTVTLRSSQTNNLFVSPTSFNGLDAISLSDTDFNGDSSVYEKTFTFKNVSKLYFSASSGSWLYGLTVDGVDLGLEDTPSGVTQYELDITSDCNVVICSNY